MDDSWFSNDCPNLVNHETHEKHENRQAEWNQGRLDGGESLERLGADLVVVSQTFQVSLRELA